MVTGAGSGIGAAIALRFGLEGARVVVADLDERAGHASAEKVQAAGGDALAICTDVARPQDVDRLADGTLRAYGRIDVLINNAGTRHAVPLVETSDADWRTMIDVNLTGVFFCVRRVAKEMIKGAVKGAIVNIASGAGLRGTRNRAAYCAAKAGVLLLTKVAALELGPSGIRINAIAPGLIETPLTAHYRAAPDGDAKMMMEHVAATIPLGRWGQPEEIAAAAIYLASDEATYVNGATLVVDAGLTAG